MPPLPNSLTNDLTFLSSRPFEIVARSGRSYFVHSAFLSAQSKPLHCATTGVWKEATEQKIDLSDWDDATVERFIHFLYSGDYLFPTTTSVGTVGGEGSQESVGALGGSPGQGQPRTSDTNPFLVHAKVYALAQYKDVGELRQMALQRLGTALSETDKSMLTSSSDMMMHILELLEYVYSNTDPLINSKEPLRTVVLNFATEHFDKLVGRGEIELLLHKESDFAVEIVKRLSRRVFSMENEIQDLRSRVAVSEERISQLEVINVQKETQRNDANMTRHKYSSVPQYPSDRQRSRVRLVFNKNPGSQPLPPNRYL